MSGPNERDAPATRCGQVGCANPPASSSEGGVSHADSRNNPAPTSNAPDTRTATEAGSSSPATANSPSLGRKYREKPSPYPTAADPRTAEA